MGELCGREKEVASFIDASKLHNKEEVLEEVGLMVKSRRKEVVDFQ